MGIIDDWKRNRATRLAADPRLRAKEAMNRRRMLESWETAGEQTSESIGKGIWNTMFRPGTGKEEVDKKGNKTKNYSGEAHMSQHHNAAVDSTAQTMKTVGRVLLATGRTAKWGIHNLWLGRKP